MLSQLELTRFQGFNATTTIPLKPLTLIFGPNASGKSSIIRSILLGQQSIKKPQPGVMSTHGFQYEGEITSLASFENVVFEHDEASTFSLKFEFSNLVNPYSRFSSRRTGEALLLRVEDLIKTLSVEWLVSAKDPVKMCKITFTFSKSEVPLTLTFTHTSDATTRGRALHLEHEGVQEFIPLLSELRQPGPMQKMLMANFEIDADDEMEDSSYHSSLESENVDQILEDSRFIFRGNFPWLIASDKETTQLVKKLSTLLHYAEYQTSRHLAGVQHIGPLREISKRLTYEAGVIMDESDEEGPPAQADASEAVVSNWLSMLTAGRYKFSPVEFYAKEVKFLGSLRSQILIDNHTNTPVTFADVGVGLSQVLPILQHLAAHRKGNNRALLIEQPELHLHPRMQANVADLFVDFLESNGGAQIIAETHSEAMLLRIQKRIREKTLNPDLVQIIYVDRANQSESPESGSGNFAFPLPIDEFGDFIMPMPNSFSSQRFEDLL